MRGIDKVDNWTLFPREEMTITRGHKFKVRWERFSKDVRGSFFTQRVVGAWNALPSEVVEAVMLATFKTYLDRHMNNRE